MTKPELEKLQRLIHSTEIFLGEMQKLHRKETGRDYVISGPLDWPKDNRIFNEVSRYFAPLKKTAKEIINETD